MEATNSANPETFKETELFKQCQASGIIPRSETELSSQKEDSPPEIPTSTISDKLKTGQTSPNSSEETLSLNLIIGNMWCPSCAWLIDERLKKNPGVINAACNFSTDRLQVNYNPIQTSPAQIIQSIQKLGYRAALPEESRDALERRKEFIRFAVCAFLTMNVMMLSYALYSGFFTEFTAETIYKLSWPAFIMATVVVAYGGFEFFKKAWAGFASAAFSMETLIIIGSSSAYIYSTVNLFAGSIHVYYDTASMLITLVLLGKTLERRAKGQVLESLENFFALKPTKVRICSDQYPEGRYVDIGHLAKDDIFQVEENEVLPADGSVFFGRGAVDESTLTGEPLPVTKKAGDIVQSGTRVIKGAFKVKTEKVGEDSTLGQMIKIIERTLLTKTPLEGKTDVILQWFVPTIMALSATTALFCWLTGSSPGDALLRAVTVMVISCPCALGIAIPLARVAGLSIAGKKGILVRDFGAFERTEKIKAFVFDKTGTITAGKWNLLDILPVAQVTADEALALAAGLETKSDHFIAREILHQADKKKIRPSRIKQHHVKAKGIEGKIDGQKIKIGSRQFLTRELENQASLAALKRVNDQPKHSYVYLGIDGELAAVFIFGDRLRADAPSTVKKLKDWGYRLALVSGDGDQTTRRVGKQIGFSESYGEKLPQDKAAFVENLQEQGIGVAMVGDGINDAPALAQADLSVAIHSGGQLSEEAADITLMRSEPAQIIDFLGFSKQVNRKISQNLFFTFLYNAIAIPVAISGLLNPLVAVTAMLLSSISVTGNTLHFMRKCS
jgi:heavy metal translocating P-type ATPase